MSTPEVQVLTGQRTQPHSIELAQNAKGEVSFTVKLYFENAGEADCRATLDRIVSGLRQTYTPGLLPKAVEG